MFSPWQSSSPGRSTIAVLVACVVLVSAGCGSEADQTPNGGTGLAIDVSPLPGGGGLAEAFLKYYEPVDEDVDVEMSAYTLPVDWQTIWRRMPLGIE